MGEILFMADRICAWANCHETDTPITLTINDTNPKQRLRFCNVIHLALWAKKEALRKVQGYGIVGMQSITEQEALSL
jgi:hypothetical protein